MGYTPVAPQQLLKSKRTSQALTRKQRLIVSAVSASLGLLCAWLLFGGSSGPPAGQAAGGEVAGTQQVPAGLASRASTADQPGTRQADTASHTLQQSGDGVGKPEAGEDSGTGAAALAAAVAASKQASASAAAQQAQQQQQSGKHQAGQKQQHPKQDKQQQQQQEQTAAGKPHNPVVAVGMEDEPQWFGKLSSHACSHAEHLRVCSHRGRLAVEGVASGSLTAYSLLFKAGVSCFDIDFVATADGHLLATHPDDLVAALGSEAAAGVTSGLHSPQGLVISKSLAELRAAGADEDRFPTADALIKVFAALLEEGGLLYKQAMGQQGPDYDQLPVLLMDLKSSAFNEEIINNVTAAAQAVAAAAHVALFITQPEQLNLVRHTRWSGPLIRAYMDRQNPNPPVTAADLEPFDLLGPSIKMADAFFAATGQLGKPVLAWTVDTPQELHRALEANLNAVISNRPLALRGVLLDWRDRCSERSSAAARRQMQRQQRQRQLRRSLLGRTALQQEATAEREQQRGPLRRRRQQQRQQLIGGGAADGL